MKVIPIIIICACGIGVCISLLIYYLVKFLVKKHKKVEEFEFEENMLTIPLKSRKNKK